MEKYCRLTLRGLERKVNIPVQLRIIEKFGAATVLDRLQLPASRAADEILDVGPGRRRAGGRL